MSQKKDLYCSTLNILVAVGGAEYPGGGMKRRALESQLDKDCSRGRRPVSVPTQGSHSWLPSYARKQQRQRWTNKGCSTRKMSPSCSMKGSFGDLGKSKGQWKRGVKSKACLSKRYRAGVGPGQAMPFWAASHSNREPDWEQLPDEGSAEIHRGEDVVHALRKMRQVLLRIGIAAASREMTMLWWYCGFVIWLSIRIASL